METKGAGRALRGAERAPKDAVKREPVYVGAERELGRPERELGGPDRELGGLRGGMEKKRNEKKKEKFPFYGGSISHHPLQGHCTKTDFHYGLNHSSLITSPSDNCIQQPYIRYYFIGAHLLTQVLLLTGPVF